MFHHGSNINRPSRGIFCQLGELLGVAIVQQMALYCLILKRVLHNYAFRSNQCYIIVIINRVINK